MESYSLAVAMTMLLIYGMEGREARETIGEALHCTRRTTTQPRLRCVCWLRQSTLLTSALSQAMAWCPWQNNLLATGGGTGDGQVHFWSSTTGARVNTLQTPTQISSVQFAPHSREVLTTHGAPVNSLMIHSYPSMSKVWDPCPLPKAAADH